MSTEELKHNLSAFKKELKKIEDYRKECHIPLKMPLRVFPMCIFGFCLYLAMLLFCVYVLPLPFFKAHSSMALVTFSLVVTSSAPVIMPLFFILAVICKSIVFFRTKEYFVFAKKIFVNAFMNVYLKENEHEPKYEPPKEDMTQFKKILPPHLSIETGDLIKGEYENFKVKICEAHCTKKVDKEKVTAFQGLLCVFESDSKFEGETYILLKKTLSVSEYARYISQNKAFNMLYDVFSSENAEAKLIIDEALTEKFIKLDKYLKAKVTCAMFKNHLFLAVPTGVEDFEVVNSFDNELNPEEIKKLLTVVKEVLDIVSLISKNSKKRQNV